MGIVVDTSVFIAAERRGFDWASFQRQSEGRSMHLSVISLAELLHGAERAKVPAWRDQRLRFMADIEATFEVIVFDREVAFEYGRMQARLAQVGTPVGPHDLIIAATALYHGHEVATLNVRDFGRVEGLRVWNVESLRRQRT
jgi:tRNA(fMet)-specific endonuclease VapC